MAALLLCFSKTFSVQFSQHPPNQNLFQQKLITQIWRRDQIPETHNQAALSWSEFNEEANKKISCTKKVPRHTEEKQHGSKPTNDEKEGPVFTYNVLASLLYMILSFALLLSFLSYTQWLCCTLCREGTWNWSEEETSQLPCSNISNFTKQSLSGTDIIKMVLLLFPNCNRFLQFCVFSHHKLFFTTLS